MACFLPVLRLPACRNGTAALAGTVLAMQLGVAVRLGASAAAAEPDWAEVAPLFRERCVMCHSQDAAALGLRLDTYEGAIAGSERGPVLVPGNVSGSELVRRLRGESQPRMPFLSRAMPAEQIGLIERWIAAGLPEVGAAAAQRLAPDR